MRSAHGARYGKLQDVEESVHFGRASILGYTHSRTRGCGCQGEDMTGEIRATSGALATTASRLLASVRTFSPGPMCCNSPLASSLPDQS